MGIKIEKLLVGPLEVCTYIVYCEKTKEGVIIDPGDEDIRILELINKLGLNIKYILGTHAHPDHIGGVDFLKNELHALYMVHKLDEEFFSNPENMEPFLSWGFPENPKADQVFEDKDIIKFGEEYLKVIHTPGHTPGSSCFYSEAHKLVFTGDTLFVGAVGRTDLPGGNFKTMMKSIKNKLFTLPDDTIVLPGHDYGPSPTSTIGKEKQTNPYIDFEEIE